MNNAARCLKLQRPIPNLLVPSYLDLPNTVVKQIHSDIRSLASIDTPGVGFTETYSGAEFAPIMGHRMANVLVIGGQPPTTTEVLNRLVSRGPKTLPYIIDSLTDVTPTQIEFRSTLAFSVVRQERDLMWNPFNRREEVVLSKYPIRNRPLFSSGIDSYRVTIGDICYVILGEIVGRPYSIMEYIPSGWAAVDSMSDNPRLCAAIHKVWSSKCPNSMLADSLMIDFHSRCVDPGITFQIGSSIQTEAAMRLLYYYPEYASPMIANRLDSIDLEIGSDKYKGRRSESNIGQKNERNFRNGMIAIDLIRAVSWCQNPHIQGALNRIRKRTDDPDVVDATKPQHRPGR